MKNKVLAVIGGTVALFGLGYLIYVVLGIGPAEGENAAAVAGELNLPAIIGMEVLYALLVTIIFSRWAQIKTFGTGAQAGLIIGALIGACSTLELFATTTGLMSITGVVYAAVTFGVRFAVAGGVIGYLLGKD